MQLLGPKFLPKIWSDHLLAPSHTPKFQGTIRSEEIPFLELQTCNMYSLHRVNLFTFLKNVPHSIACFAESSSDGKQSPLHFHGPNQPTGFATLYLRTLQLYINRSWCYTGGTIGLFTGLSLVSMIEFAFWVVRLCKDLAQVAMGRKSHYSKQAVEDEWAKAWCILSAAAVLCSQDVMSF